MSQTIELHLKAFDEASSTIASVNSSLTGSLSKIDDSTKQVTASTTNMGKAYESASGQVNEINAQYGKVAESTEKVDASTKKSSISLTQQVGAVNQLASSGVILALSFDRVEKAQLASDKANLNVQRSAEKLDQAQKDLTETTAKYGAGSAEAKDAQDKLRIAEEAHNVSIERQQIVSQDLNQTYMQTAVSIIPAVIGVVTSLSAVKGILFGATQAEAVAEGVGAAAKTAALGPTGALTGATWGLNSALLANPIVWVVVAIAALVAALILAYNYCKPFKDAVDALGAAIGQGLSQALAVVKGALEWLWKNIFEPFVAFISFGAMIAIEKITGALKWLGDVLKPVGDAFGWLAGIVGGAIDTVGKEMQKGQDLTEAMTESTKNGLSVMENYYTNKFEAMAKTVSDSMNKQLETIEAKNQEAVDIENKAHDEDIAAFTVYWDQKFGVANSALTELTGTITKHYDDELSETRSSYDKLIEECNAYYDGLQVATDAGLLALRASRETALDDMELLMLQEKVNIEQAHAAGLLSDEEYQKQKSELSKRYNEERGVVTDQFRLKELQMEKENNDASTIIASEREAAVTAIKTKEATTITAIETKKNTDLNAASKQFNEIEKAHADELLRLQTEKANAIHEAEVKKSGEKRAALDALEKQINADVNLSEAEKVRIIQGANDEIQISTSTSWGLIAGTIHRSLGEIQSDLVNLGASVETAKAAAAGVQAAQSTVDAAGALTPKQATINQLNAQLAVFEAAIASGQYTRAQVQPGIDATKRQLVAAQAMALGGIVTEPTFALIGEAGPEAVIPLNKFNSMAETSNQTYVFSPNITVNASPGMVSNPRQLARELLDEMNSLIRNDMKSKTFFTQG